MRNGDRRLTFASLGGLAVAFGWIEASAVIYLREVYLGEVALHGTSTFSGLQITLVSLPDRLVALEMVREACTIVLLGTVAWLAGRRYAERVGAFLLTFGVWDLTYYAVLNLVAGWPTSPTAWDILFLIPLPWVAPIWAPVTVAVLFAVAGSYLLWTAERERRYAWADLLVLSAAVVLTIAAFLVESSAATDHRVPQHFPAWLFWSGVLLGAAWFIRIERRVHARQIRAPWLGVSVRTLAPTLSRPTRDSDEEPDAGERSNAVEEVDVDGLIRRYADAAHRREALLNEAGGMSERLERLAHGLSAHPQRMLVGAADAIADDPNDWDVVPGQPLPRIEHIATLTDEIRDATLALARLRERLILLGRADVVQQPDAFFH